MGLFSLDFEGKVIDLKTGRGDFGNSGGSRLTSSTLFSSSCFSSVD